jgi:hypothetical protein
MRKYFQTAACLTLALCSCAKPEPKFTASAQFSNPPQGMTPPEVVRLEAVHVENSTVTVTMRSENGRYVLSCDASQDSCVNPVALGATRPHRVAVSVALLSSGRISVPSSSESRPRTVHGFRILFFVVIPTEHSSRRRTSPRFTALGRHPEERSDEGSLFDCSIT